MHCVRLNPRALFMGTWSVLVALLGSCAPEPDQQALPEALESDQTPIASAGEISVGTPTLDKIPVNQFRGLNWGYNRTQPDLGNYSRGILRLPLLDLADSPAVVIQKTNVVLDNFLNAGANTIRIPVNIATVANNWTNFYHYVVTTALNRNFKVILCFWLDSTNKITDMAGVKQMWYALASRYYFENVRKVYPLVFYELANEPCGYLQDGSDYLPDMRAIANYLQSNFPGIKKRIMVGGTDYSAYPGPVAVDADLQDCYLAVHFYDTWAHDYSTTLKGLKYYPKYYDDALMYQIRWRNGVMDPSAQNWFSRIVITEFGEWTDRGYGYTSKTTQRTTTSITPNTTYANDVEGIRIAYIFGTGGVVNRLQIGSVMWGGLIADGYSLFKYTTAPVALSRNDYSATTQLTELQLPLRAIFWGAKSTTGTYAVNNLSPIYSLTTDAINGTIALNPPGGIYSSGTSVTLTATPAAGYVFTGWSGGLTGKTTPAVLTMNASKNVTATFIPTSVSDLAWKQVSNGWGPVEKDKSNGGSAAGDGRILTLNGKTYTKGFGCHAASEISVPLNKLYKTFTSDIGVDDEVGSNGSVVFQVVMDGVTKFTSSTMTGSSATQTVSVDVTGATTLSLKVGDAGNGNGHDHADWAGAKLTAAP